ncbi:MAG: flavin reductase [Erythrobacter sp.]|nr:flavin reductase [Erythrobacter sp.]
MTQRMNRSLTTRADSEQDAIATALKGVLRFMPAPVGIVTGTDPDSGDPVGLAMSAIMPVALEPCAMAVAINRSGSSHDAIIRSGRFCINLLHPSTSDHLAPFAGPARRAERFQLPGWQRRDGEWYIEDAPASIFCRIAERLGYGTHDILVGEVTDVIASGETEILGWCNGQMGTLAPLIT